MFNHINFEINQMTASLINQCSCISHVISWCFSILVSILFTLKNVILKKEKAETQQISKSIIPNKIHISPATVCTYDAQLKKYDAEIGFSNLTEVNHLLNLFAVWLVYPHPPGIRV